MLLRKQIFVETLCHHNLNQEVLWRNVLDYAVFKSRQDKYDHTNIINPFLLIVKGLIIIDSFPFI